jgi:hypothetical protein
MRTTHVASAVGKILMAVVVALVIGSISAGPALAGEYGRRDAPVSERERRDASARERERREQQRHEREWQWPRGYRPYGYARPAEVYSPPPPVVYAPPPPPPGFTFIFPIRIH